MDLHDVARGRGSLEAAMARISAPALTIGISTDMLYPTYQQRQIVELLASIGSPAGLRRDRLAARPRRLPDQPRSVGGSGGGLPGLSEAAVGFCG